MPFRQSGALIPAAQTLVVAGMNWPEWVFTPPAARGMLRQSISQFLPLYAVLTFGLNMEQAGLLVTVYLLAESISQLFVGPAADRMNRKLLMIVGGAITSVLGFLLNQMGNSWSLMALLVPVAIVSTIGRVPALAYNVDLGHKYGRMGSSMGITNAAQDMGHFLGPLITGWAIDQFEAALIILFKWLDCFNCIRTRHSEIKEKPRHLDSGAFC